MNAHLIVFLSKITMPSFWGLLLSQTLVSWLSSLQISDWPHHTFNYRAEIASSQTSNSDVVSSTKTSYLPAFLTSILSMNRFSFISQSSPSIPLKCPYSAFLFVSVMGRSIIFSSCVLLLHPITAHLGHHFLYHFNKTLISLPPLAFFPIIISVLPTPWAVKIYQLWSQLNLSLNCLITQ